MIEDKCFILQIDSLFWNDTVIVRFIKDILKINGMIFPEIICMHLHNLLQIQSRYVLPGK